MARRHSSSRCCDRGKLRYHGIWVHRSRPCKSRCRPATESNAKRVFAERIVDADRFLPRQQFFDQVGRQLGPPAVPVAGRRLVVGFTKAEPVGDQVANVGRRAGQAGRHIRAAADAGQRRRRNCPSTLSCDGIDSCWLPLDVVERRLQTASDAGRQFRPASPASSRGACRGRRECAPRCRSCVWPARRSSRRAGRGGAACRAARPARCRHIHSSRTIARLRGDRLPMPDTRRQRGRSRDIQDVSSHGPFPRRASPAGSVSASLRLSASCSGSR